MMEDARDQAKRKAAEQAKVAQDKLEEYLAQGGFYTALAEFLVDLPMFPYACMKGPTVRIKTQVKWTKDVSPFPTLSNGHPNRGQRYPVIHRLTYQHRDTPSGAPPTPSQGMSATPGQGAGGVTQVLTL